MDLTRHLSTNDPRPPRFSILIVDNEPITRHLLTSTLSRQYPDIRLFLAGNGAAGLKMFKDKHPDMIISDNNMPIMTGVQMVSKIQELNRKTIVVFLTADLDNETLSRLMDAGTDHFLQKPIIVRELFDIVDRYREDCLRTTSCAIPCAMVGE